MKHLYIIVEGQTEAEFVERLLISYLSNQGLHTNIQPIKITMSGGGHGFNNIEHFRNTIKPIMYYKDEPIITTMIDYSGINSEKKMPNYLNCIEKSDVEQRILCMEESLKNYVNTIKPYTNFIPNILRHEFETLLFANPEDGFDLEDEQIKREIIDLKSKYLSIEDINSSPETFPSKRIESIYSSINKKYNKIADGVDIAELTGINSILKECPHFKNWLDKITHVVLES
ncbi:uncharacterized protein DUF4276 [Arcicella aurantiaca]|uniref:Uncharacterized protein DUF4276 n=1 Tax=Arcicella aurantiaca TaxID=591202 RepID=A0A316DWA6_9BACT|nr:DUF4276 family protein [Arcicella aurantiaca]PWK22647.1 uncharacterized protein DUF4276 [Arcicella aurantiaca]